MKMNYSLVLPAVLVLVLIPGCINDESPAPIGGERDEHGCLGPAGYSWAEDVGACVRSWELDESESKAARIAVKHVGAEKGLTVVKVETLRCPGCFKVNLNLDGAASEVNLAGWKVIEGEQMTDGLCTRHGGSWNECGSKCMIDNQGREGVACTLQCEQLCECGGIAGFACPPGFECKMPDGIADAMGYCA